MRRLTLLPLLLLLAACARSKPPVILISIDTLRADHVPAQGAIASLKRDGVSFESAWSHCPMTLPSHVSMLTGLLPTGHGVRNNVGFTFDPQRHKTIAQALHDEGYATGAAVSASTSPRWNPRSASRWSKPSRCATVARAR
jgi:arylsulfatase A-like enzyme